MSTYFTLVKHVFRDILEIGDLLSEDEVRKFLLRSDYENLYQVSEFDSNGHNGDGNPLLIDHLNGEEWLYKHL